MSKRRSEKIKNWFYRINKFFYLIAILGLILVLVDKYVMAGALASIVSIYNYVMLGFGAVVALSFVAMLIRSVLRIRIIGIVRSSVSFAISLILLFFYAYLANMSILLDLI